MLVALAARRGYVELLPRSRCYAAQAPRRSKPSPPIKQKRPAQDTDTVVSQRSLIQAAALKHLASQAHVKKTAPSKDSKPSPPPTSFHLRKAYKTARAELRLEQEKAERDVGPGTDVRALRKSLIEAQKMNVDFDYLKMEEIPALDVQIPSKFALRTLLQPTTLLRTSRTRIANVLKNATSMYLLAFLDAFPSHSLSHAGTLARYTTWVWRSLRVTGVKEGDWVDGFRKECWRTYVKFLEAKARGDTKMLSEVTTLTYRAHDKPYPPMFDWELIKQNAPVRIVSIRTALVTKDPPQKYVVQALVRFDVTQTVLEETAGIVPRRTVVYYLMERRLWEDDGIWKIRKRADVGEGRV